MYNEPKEVMSLTDFEEKTFASRTIYEGKVVNLQVDHVHLPDGRTSKREIVKHPGAVAVIAITPENKLILVRQYRKALEKTIIEIPAGKLEPGEDPAICAKRELEEETGYRAKNVRPLVSFYTSPGFANEYLHLYVAENLEEGKVNLDQDEFVELVEYTKEECIQAIQSQEICDAKTVLAVHLWQEN